MKTKLFIIGFSILSISFFGQHKKVASKQKTITQIKPLEYIEMLCFKPFEPYEPHDFSQPTITRYYTKDEYDKLSHEEKEQHQKDSIKADFDNKDYAVKKEKYTQSKIEYNKALTIYNKDLLKYNDCLAYNRNLKKGVVTKQIDEYEDYHTENVITGDLGCSNIIPKYDNSFDTSLLVKNHGDLDMVLKLIDLETDTAIRMVYIKKNSTFEITHIPQGRYMMKEAHGAKWKQKIIADKCTGIFTENAIYKKSKNIADFNITKSINGDVVTTHIPSYELELGIKIIRKPGAKNNSSYQTDTISSSQFNQ